MTEAAIFRTSFPAADLGGPAAPDPAKCSVSAIAELAKAAGPEMRMNSLALDVTSHVLGDGQVTVTASVEKRARSIVFASVEARAASGLVYSAQGLFSRAG